ncbi:hypothetical protein [Arenimonas sp.]|uniref:hypothetical protein n=1 Tax=Arenimonas sp. TaxID=1872635 RepID=UPI0039E302CF
MVGGSWFVVDGNGRREAPVFFGGQRQNDHAFPGIAPMALNPGYHPRMTTPMPRWLKLTMLPILAATAFCIDFEIQHRLARFGFDSDFDAYSSHLVMFGKLVAPFLAALAIAYPVARLYGRNWLLASMGIALLFLTVHVDSFFDREDLGGFVIMMVTPFWFALFLAALSAGLHRAMHESRLVVAPMQESEDARDLADPTALKLMLLPIFVVGLFLIHDFWQPFVQKIGFLPTTRTGDRVGMLCAGFVGPALLALLVAPAVARIYGRHALVVGAIVPLLTTGWWVLAYLREDWSFYVRAMYLTEILTLTVGLPIVAWWAARRFKGTRLAVDPEPGTSAE